jgi:acetolactate synthase-1/3 small subunit
MVKGDEQIIEQISKQVSKMMEVLKIKVLRDDELVSRELALIKVRSTPKTRGEIMEIISIFRSNVVDISQNTLTIEMSGGRKKLDAFLAMVEPYGVEEISRTGITAIERGTNMLKLDK